MHFAEALLTLGQPVRVPHTVYLLAEAHARVSLANVIHDSDAIAVEVQRQLYAIEAAHSRTIRPDDEDREDSVGGRLVSGSLQELRSRQA